MARGTGSFAAVGGKLSGLNVDQCHRYSHREWLENDPDLAVLLEDPRFQALLDSLPAIPDA